MVRNSAHLNLKGAVGTLTHKGRRRFGMTEESRDIFVYSKEDEVVIRTTTNWFSKGEKISKLKAIWNS